jgi:hypothetical protein
VLGFHGCDESVARRLLDGEPFITSTNAFDWLGNGVYFWEANPQRGLAYAKEVAARGGAVQTPTVIGAVISLGLCLDMTTSSGIALAQTAYKNLTSLLAQTTATMPRNRADMLLRYRDRAVIEHVHALLALRDISVDTVRGVFIEGAPIYEGAGFFEKTHIQIAVRNPTCIKGVFRVPSRYLAST